MALSEIDLQRCKRDLERFMEKRRPPPHLRPKLDLGYRIEGQSVTLFEIRPDWREPSIRRESPFAKATYVRTRKHWRVFWMRRDLKWHGYEPRPQVGSLEEFLGVVDEDAWACFFG